MKNQVLMVAIGLLLATGVSFGQDEEKEEKHSYRKRTKDDFKLELGLNNYLLNGQFPDVTNEPYTVRPIGSWYVGLGAVYLTHIGGPLYAEWGGDVTWYNFKFEDESMRISKTADGVQFSTEQNADIRSEKSKLTASYLNASFVPMLKLGKHNSSVRIGAGMYAGYRLGGYTKLVYETNNLTVKDKEKDNYYMQNLRYGVRARFGFKDVDFFANYDLNNLFVDGKGPELNAISAGIVITDLFD